jgi:hypothetical protein
MLTIIRIDVNGIGNVFVIIARSLESKQFSCKPGGCTH